MRFSFVAAAILVAQCATVSADPALDHHHRHSRHEALARRHAEAAAKATADSALERRHEAIARRYAELADASELVAKASDDSSIERRHEALARSLTEAAAAKADELVARTDADSDLECRDEEKVIKGVNVKWYKSTKFHNPSCGGQPPSDKDKACIVSTSSRIACGSKISISIHGKKATCTVVHRRSDWSKKRVRTTKAVYLDLTDHIKDGKLTGARVTVLSPGEAKHSNAEKPKHEHHAKDHKDHGHKSSAHSSQAGHSDADQHDADQAQAVQQQQDKEQRQQELEKQKQKQHDQQEAERKQHEKEQRQQEIIRQKQQKEKEEKDKAAKDKAHQGGGGDHGGGQVYGNAKATFFYQGGAAGNCGKVSQDHEHVVAIHSSMYDGGSHCGQRIRVTRKDNGRSVECVVADSCPTCETNTSVDLSVGAFKAIATEAEGSVPVDWHYIS